MHSVEIPLGIWRKGGVFTRSGRRLMQGSDVQRLGAVMQDWKRKVR